MKLAVTVSAGTGVLLAAFAGLAHAAPKIPAYLSAAIADFRPARGRHQARHLLQSGAGHRLRRHQAGGQGRGLPDLGTAIIRASSAR